MAARRGARAGGWLLALMGLAALAFLGFGAGLLAGGLFQAPDLVLGHWLGETEEVAWSREAAAPPRQPTAAAAPPAVASAPPAVAAAPPDAGTAARGDFAVQVGAFSDSGAAERLAAQLREKGYSVYLAAGAREGESRWRVRVGPLASRGDAERTAERLKSAEKLPTWVLSEAAGAP